MIFRHFLREMVSHGQTVHFRPHSVIHIRKAEHLRIPKFRLKVNFRHPMKRQIFGDTSGQDPNLHLALCLTLFFLQTSLSHSFQKIYYRASCVLRTLCEDRKAVTPQWKSKSVTNQLTVCASNALHLENYFARYKDNGHSVSLAATFRDIGGERFGENGRKGK